MALSTAISLAIKLSSGTLSNPSASPCRHIVSSSVHITSAMQVCKLWNTYAPLAIKDLVAFLWHEHPEKISIFTNLVDLEMIGHDAEFMKYLNNLPNLEVLKFYPPQGNHEVDKSETWLEDFKVDLPQLKTLTVPEGFLWWFRGCKSLETLRLSRHRKGFPTEILAGFSNLKSLKVDDRVRHVSLDAVVKLSSTLEEIDFRVFMGPYENPAADFYRSTLLKFPHVTHIILPYNSIKDANVTMETFLNEKNPKIQKILFTSEVAGYNDSTIATVASALIGSIPSESFELFTRFFEHELSDRERTLCDLDKTTAVEEEALPVIKYIIQQSQLFCKSKEHFSSQKMMWLLAGLAMVEGEEAYECIKMMVDVCGIRLDVESDDPNQQTGDHVLALSIERMSQSAIGESDIAFIGS